MKKEINLEILKSKKSWLYAATALTIFTGGAVSIGQSHVSATTTTVAKASNPKVVISGDYSSTSSSDKVDAETSTIFPHQALTVPVPGGDSVYNFPGEDVNYVPFVPKDNVANQAFILSDEGFYDVLAVISVKDGIVSGDYSTGWNGTNFQGDSSLISLSYGKISGSFDSKTDTWNIKFTYLEPAEYYSYTSDNTVDDAAAVTATTKPKTTTKPKSVATPTENIYRLYNKNTGEHFYTASAMERNSLKAAGWSYEGIGWESAMSGAPVYRVYNPNAKGGDHYYTMSKFEAQSLVNKGWKWDNGGKPVFYSKGTKNLYVAYNPHASSGAHNYTTSSFEQSSLIKSGWKYSAVAWKVEK